MFDDRPDDVDPDVRDLADAERVSDPSTVYDDIDSLPEWWRTLVHEFAERDLRPYRPSRLADDEIVYEVVRDLEERFDVLITVKSTDPGTGGEWKFVVDGTTAIVTTHDRKAEGYTQYGVTSEELVDAVSAVASETP